jgi:uncharacterized protein (DUF1778 family)
MQADIVAIESFTSRLSGNMPYNNVLTQEIAMATKPVVARTTPSAKTARLEARISENLHLTVKRAAELEGRTVTDFVVHALQLAASQTIEQFDNVRLSVADQKIFANAILKPAKPNAVLKRAFVRANKILDA